MTANKTNDKYSRKRLRANKRNGGKNRLIYWKLCLPLFLLLIFAGAFFLPKTSEPGGGTNIKTISAEGVPATLVLEQQGEHIKSAWLRSPAGTREIEGLQDMSHVSEGLFVAKGLQEGKDELLWRTSFTNFAGKGVHLWVGLSPTAEKIFIATSPYNYTKWDNIPAKLVVPKGTAIYISPAIPDYSLADTDSKEGFQTKDSYSFVYTVRMTPEGPAFVPAPGVYRQLSVLLRAGIRGETSANKRLAYTRMLEEFEKLAAGNPPSAGTLLNFQINRIYTLPWRN